jgi:transcription elongation factor Elf1
MSNPHLAGLLQSVLGKGSETARNNMKFSCPFCKHSKQKLEINLITNSKKENPWHCWVCHTKGKTIRSLFKKMGVYEQKKSELNTLIVPSKEEYVKSSTDKPQLPKEFIPLVGVSAKNIDALFAINYLKKRKVSKEDIIKYNIGYCSTGNFANCIIVPSYDEYGELNYFIARKYDESASIKYKNPNISRDVIGLEFFINWEMPIILCEGIFDAMAIKRNVIPLLGTNIQSTLMKKLVTSKVKKIYLALDKDAQKMCLEHAMHLMDNGKEVYLVELKDKDPSDMGFKRFTELIQHTEPLTFQELLMKKLEL